jgi:splicing factor U2AF subunit
MAKYLAQIHGTEEDKVNCPFYFKIGCCRHSERCSRLHHKPAFSQTLLIKHLYQHPVRLAELQQASTGSPAQPAAVNDAQSLEDFFVFFEDLYLELGKFGVLEELHVVDNLGDHMIGHVYVKYADEEMAADALQALQNRYYDGRLVQAEFSPVTDFKEARCRDFDDTACARAGYCNFLHVKPVPACLIQSLEDDVGAERRRKVDDDRRDKKKRRKETSSSSSGRDRDRDRKKRSKHHSRSRSRSRSESSY